MNPSEINRESQVRFHHILAQERVQASELLELLKQEYELLKANPDKTLESLLARKRTQLKHVEQSVAAHHQFLRQMQLSPDRKGTEAFLELCGGEPKLQQAWEAYLEIAQACKRQNEINGGAVALNQRQVNQALTLLLGLGESNKTYGPSGESRPVRPSNSLGKA